MSRLGRTGADQAVHGDPVCLINRSRARHDPVDGPASLVGLRDRHLALQEPEFHLAPCDVARYRDLGEGGVVPGDQALPVTPRGVALLARGAPVASSHSSITVTHSSIAGRARAG